MRILYNLIELMYQPKETADLDEILSDMLDAFGTKAFDNFISSNLQATGCGNENCDSNIDWQ